MKVVDGGQSLGVLVGPAILYNSDFRLGSHVLSTVTWMPVFRVGLSASVLAPVTPARLITPEGKVQAFATFYRLGAVLEVTRPKSPVSLRLTAALGIGELHISGNTGAPYVSASDTHYVACPSLGMTTRFVLMPGVSLFADVAGQVAFPKTVIRVIGHETTQWGRPALSAALGLECCVARGCAVKVSRAASAVLAVSGWAPNTAIQLEVALPPDPTTTCVRENVMQFTGAQFGTMARLVQDDFSIEVWLKTDSSLMGDQRQGRQPADQHSQTCSNT